jgi:hypothetical protein
MSCLVFVGGVHHHHHRWLPAILDGRTACRRLSSSRAVALLVVALPGYLVARVRPLPRTSD